jgi:hypothetical protein
MKKLALASVALAGVSAFGAGDAFAAPTWVAVTNSNYAADAHYFNDSATWTGVDGSSGTTTSVLSNEALHRNVYVGVSASNPLGTHEPYSLEPGVVGSKAAIAPSTVTAIFGKGVGATSYFSHNGPVFAFTMNFLTKTATGYEASQQILGVGLEMSPVFGASKSCYSVPGNRPPDGCGSFHGPTKYLESLNIFSASDKSLGSFSQSVTMTTPQFIGFAETKGSTPIAYATGTIASTSGYYNPTFFGDAIGPISLQEKPIPDPATLSILGIGLLGVGALRRRSRATSDSRGTRWSPFGRWRVTDRPPDPTTS